MLTVEGKHVTDLSSVVVVSHKVALIMEQRIKEGKCACLACVDQYTGEAKDAQRK